MKEQLFVLYRNPNILLADFCAATSYILHSFLQSSVATYLDSVKC